MLVTGKADRREQRTRLLARGAALSSEQPAEAAGHFKLAADDDIVDRGQMRKHRVALENDAAVEIRLRLQRLVFQKDRAARRLLLAEKHTQEGRLAASRGPDQDQEGARLDLEIDLLEHDMVAVLLPHFVEDDGAHAALACANQG